MARGSIAGYRGVRNAGSLRSGLAPRVPRGFRPGDNAHRELPRTALFPFSNRVVHSTIRFLRGATVSTVARTNAAAVDRHLWRAWGQRATHIVPDPFPT